MQTVRGVIFASGLQREVFTAGNDIKELYAPQTSIARHVPAMLEPLLAYRTLQSISMILCPVDEHSSRIQSGCTWHMRRTVVCMTE